MFRELKKEVASPTDKHPAARVWRDSHLRSVISRVRKREIAELKNTFPSAKDVVSRMLEIGWVQIIPVESDSEAAPTLYLLDMEATKEEMPDPWELMQGYDPDGVLCYFGAAAFHELTTQEPAFYHIADLRPSGVKSEGGEGRSAEASGSTDRNRDPIGTLAFRFQGVACYTTGREKSTIPGIQTREYGTRTRLRITSVEQTMLDTLWQPLKCGGESLVFEVWERGVQKWNSDKMAKHLEAISRPDWERRVGAVLAMLGIEPDGRLKRLLETRKDSVKQANDTAPLPLMPGLPASRLLSEWGILTP